MTLPPQDGLLPRPVLASVDSAGVARRGSVGRAAGVLLCLLALALNALAPLAHLREPGREPAAVRPAHAVDGQFEAHDCSASASRERANTAAHESTRGHEHDGHDCALCRLLVSGRQWLPAPHSTWYAAPAGRGEQVPATATNAGARVVARGLPPGRAPPSGPRLQHPTSVPC